MDAAREHRAAGAAAKRAGLRRAALGPSARAANRPHREKSALRRRLCLWPDARPSGGRTGTGRLRVVPMEDWHVCIEDAHVGFIDWDEYLRNRAHPDKQRRRLPAVGLAHRGAPRGGGAVAVAGDLRPLRAAHEHAIQQRSSASQPAGALLLRLQYRGDPLRTEDLPEHARRPRRCRDIPLRDRHVEPQEHRSCPGGPAAGRSGVRRGRCPARQAH